MPPFGVTGYPRLGAATIYFIVRAKRGSAEARSFLGTSGGTPVTATFTWPIARRTLRLRHGRRDARAAAAALRRA